MTVNKNATFYKGTHSDENGQFEVALYDDGWYWIISPDHMGDAIGPYTTSGEAYRAAKAMDFSIYHDTKNEDLPAVSRASHFS